MPTTKTISQIGDTKLEVIKDKDYYDSFKFTVDDLQGTPHSPKTVMYVSSEPISGAERPMSTTGRVSMSNATVGTIVANNTTVVTDITLGGKLLMRDANSTETDIRAAIYAEKNASDPNNHRLILDPYRMDDSDPNQGDANNGTVYIRGNLIVEGDRTVLDTAEHVTSDDYFGINAKIDADGVLTGGQALVAGIKVYRQENSTSPLLHNSLEYDFTNDTWKTPNANFSTGDISAGYISATKVDAGAGEVATATLTATGVSSLSNVDILGGSIKNTTIGGDGSVPSERNAGYFTTVNTTGTVTAQGGFSTAASSNLADVTASGHLIAQSGLTVSNGTTSFDAGFSAAYGTVGYLVAGSATLVPGPGEVHSSGGVFGDVTGNVTGNVTGDVTGNLTGNVNVATGESAFYDVTVSRNLNVTGAVGIDGNFDIATNKFTVDAVTGNTTLSGSLDANSTADIADTLTLSKASGAGLNVIADATVGGTLDVTGVLTAASGGFGGGDVTAGTFIGNLEGNVNVATGVSDFNNVDVNGDGFVGGTLDVAGILNANGVLNVTGPGAADPPTEADNVLNVTGNAYFSSILLSEMIVSNVDVRAKRNLVVEVDAHVMRDLTVDGTITGDVTGTVSSISNHSTDDLAEGSTNVYYLDSRARAAISVATDSVLSYDSATGILSAPGIGSSFETSFAAESISNLSDVDTATGFALSSDYDKYGLVWDESVGAWRPNGAVEYHNTLQGAYIYYNTSTGGTLTNGHGTFKINGGLYVENNKNSLESTSHPDGVNSNGVTAEAAIITEGGIMAFGGLTTAGVINGGGDLSISGNSSLNTVTTDGPVTIGADLTVNGISTFNKVTSLKADPSDSGNVAAYIYGGIRHAQPSETNPAFDIYTDVFGVYDGKPTLGATTVDVLARSSQAKAFGNIVPVTLDGSSPELVKTVSGANGVSGVPLGADLSGYCVTHCGSFASGNVVLALVSSAASATAIFSFSYCNGVMNFTLDQEVYNEYGNLHIDFNSDTQTIDLFIDGTNVTQASYCVKFLPIVTFNSISDVF